VLGKIDWDGSQKILGLFNKNNSFYEQDRPKRLVVYFDHGMLRKCRYNWSCQNPIRYYNF
jgi:hypothetical protein